MQLTSFILGLSASVAFAAPTENGATQDLAERTLQDLDAAFDHIFTGLDKLNADVIAFSGPVDAAKLEASNKAIEEAINQGGVAIKASKSMSIPELLNILGPVTVMQNAVAETVNTLGKYKNKLTAAKVDVLSMLTRDRAAADTLVAAIKANLPLSAITGPVAGPIAATITTELDRGIKMWGGVPAKGSAPGPSKATTPKATIPKGTAPRVPKAGKGTFAKGKAAKGSTAPPVVAPPASAPGMAGMAGMEGM